MAKKDPKKEAEAKEKSKQSKLALEAKSRAEARKLKNEQAKKIMNVKTPKKGDKLVKIKGLCNMSCRDGYQLEIGKESLITEDEAKRLDADERMKFFERL